MPIVLKECAWGPCDNEFPDHYWNDVCGARHTLVIADENSLALAFIALCQIQGLTKPNYQFAMQTQLSEYGELHFNATCVVVIVTNDRIRRLAEKVLELVPHNSVLILVPEGNENERAELSKRESVRVATNGEEAAVRLAEYLKATWGRRTSAVEANVNA